MNVLPHVGLFSIGLDTYWPQFEGLYDRLMGHHHQISDRISQERVKLIDSGMVDSSAKSRQAIDRFKPDKVDLVPVPVYHGKPGKGLSIQMAVQTGPVTLLSICETATGQLRLLCAEGRATDGPTLQIGNTNNRYQFELSPRDFVNAWSAEGPSHHMAVGVGHRAEDKGARSRLAWTGKRTQLLARLGKWRSRST